ncbi:hypothetical protein ACFWHG_19210 [Streptomyces microflavus]|uniref:hypothetical protein n=1 Tax=Streptomyces microflavus TaxID=1919 RepID=UPI00364E1024
MISARLRYIALALLALGFYGAGVAWLQAGIWIGAAGSLYLGCVCLLGCARIRQTIRRHQAEQERELAHLTPDTWAEPWAGWCCERGWLTRGDLHTPDRCTGAQQ